VSAKVELRMLEGSGTLEIITAVTITLTISAATKTTNCSNLGVPKLLLLLLLQLLLLLHCVSKNIPKIFNRNLKTNFLVGIFLTQLAIK